MVSFQTIRLNYLTVKVVALAVNFFMQKLFSLVIKQGDNPYNY